LAPIRPLLFLPFPCTAATACTAAAAAAAAAARTGRARPLPPLLALTHAPRSPRCYSLARLCKHVLGEGREGGAERRGSTERQHRSSSRVPFFTSAPRGSAFSAANASPAEPVFLCLVCALAGLPFFVGAAAHGAPPSPYLLLSRSLGLSRMFCRAPFLSLWSLCLSLSLSISLFFFPKGSGAYSHPLFLQVRCIFATSLYNFCRLFSISLPSIVRGLALAIITTFKLS
jgi:hypothetical protein